MFNSLRRALRPCGLLLFALVASCILTDSARANTPAGSYTQSCSSIQVSGTTLSANCQDMQGNSDATQLSNYTACVGDIANFAGSLTCSNTSIPGGSYQQSCRFVWAQKDSSGTTLNANCETTTGLWSQGQLWGSQSCTGDIANLDGVLACTVGPGVHAAFPVGSYSDSCRNKWLFNNVLNAECQTMSGGWVPAQINPDNCTSDIMNFNGMLACSAGAAPSGSYAQSCNVVWTSNNPLTLNAACLDTGNNRHTAQLIGYDQCLGDIANFDGVLGCNIGGQPPAGSYTQSCRMVWRNGTVLNAECKNTGGNWLTTSLSHVDQCSSDVANLDGILACNSGTPANGSYTQSCRNMWSLAGVLHAECKTTSGNWLTTSLQQFGNCSADIANINGILQCASFGTNFPTAFQVAGVVLHDQEQSNWCWASTGEMIMGYFGTQVTQCNEVKTEKGLGNCCGFPIFSIPYLTDQQMNCQGCNCGGYPPYTAYGHNGTNSSAALSWTQLQNQLAGKNKPFSFAWNWCGGGAHVLVAFGYTTAGGNQVWIMDPMSDEPYLNSYDAWSSNPTNNGKCSASDAYGHAFQGNEYDIN